MKERERISKIIDAINTNSIHDLFIRLFGTNFEDAEIKIVKHRIKIKKYWMAHHDMLFTNVLVNMGYIDLLPGDWYYTTDDNIFLALTAHGA